MHEGEEFKGQFLLFPIEGKLKNGLFEGKDGSLSWHREILTNIKGIKGKTLLVILNIGYSRVNNKDK